MNPSEVIDRVMRGQELTGLGKILSENEDFAKAANFLKIDVNEEEILTGTVASHIRKMAQCWGDISAMKKFAEFNLPAFLIAIMHPVLPESEDDTAIIDTASGKRMVMTMFSYSYFIVLLKDQIKRWEVDDNGLFNNLGCVKEVSNTFGVSEHWLNWFRNTADVKIHPYEVYDVDVRELELGENLTSFLFSGPATLQ